MPAAFNALLFRLAAASDEEMGAPWTWPGRNDGRTLSVRDGYHALLRAEQAAAATAPAPATEAAAIVEIAQAAFGDLRGLLAGLTELDLDRVPGEGEWPIREVLCHVLHTERRFAFQVGYALGRQESEPVYVNPTLELEAGDRVGGPGEWIERLEQSRSESARFAELGAAALERPTVWGGFGVDVRFRLHRFAEHLAEHTIHCQKQLQMEGVPLREAAELTRRISALRGRHELRSTDAALAGLDRAQTELAASLAI